MTILCYTELTRHETIVPYFTLQPFDRVFDCISHIPQGVDAYNKGERLESG